MVTSGINDVDRRTTWAPVTAGVERIVRVVEDRAYDQRISRMVGGYFHDMAAVLTALHSRLRSGGVVCIDVGDSIYAGVHVPTDDLLVEVGRDVGFVLRDRVHLRERMSRAALCANIV